MPKNAWSFNRRKNFDNDFHSSPHGSKRGGHEVGGSSGNTWEMRGRGGGRPPGLRGKEIGLYYRNLQKTKKKHKKVTSHLVVSLDSHKYNQIRKLLDSINTNDSLYNGSPKLKYKKMGTSNERERVNQDLDATSVDSCGNVKQEKPDIGLCNVKSERTVIDLCNVKPEITVIDLCNVKQERTDNDLCNVKQDSADVESCSNIKQEKTDIDSCSNKKEAFKEPGNESRTTQSSTGDKYSHIGESAFKHKFLQMITGSIESKLELCLSIKLALPRDKEVDSLLKSQLLSKQSSSHYKKMLAFREKLPSFQRKQHILDLIDQNQVILISGETGCGKTTQVGQFILDDEIMKGRGSLCQVVCTQPRRISAISVAERVADERDEVCGVESTGYQIRLDKALPRKHGSILFCTTGILLQWMQHDPGLTKVSHLVLDEIHERDVTSDFVITILKNVIPKRRDLKVILMSATLNAEQFSRYYDNCPSINIPGFTYPVEEFYLEDVLQLTNFAINPRPQPTDKWKRSRSKYKKKSSEFVEFIEPFVRHLRSGGKYSPHVLDILTNPASEELNIDLIAALIQYICTHHKDGAILVFLPGWADINKLHNILLNSGNFPTSRYLIIPLHSMMPTTTQRSVFDKPPQGVRKIVIATNIAETSITIDDVVYVVDCGKIKMTNFDVENNISTLKAQWVSLANARQRRGRAGRVQPGVCYHLYTRARETTLEQYPLPEMLRTRLEMVILQAKMLQLGKVQSFLQRVPDPPDPRATELSLKLLRTLNALDGEENLTPLGYHLAKLPLDPQTGKMILMGAIFSCVDPIFSIAAGLSFKDPFVVPLGREKDVNKVRMQFSMGMKSDHLVLAEVVKQWERAEDRRRGREFCWESFLSPNILGMLRDMKKQFAEYLYEMNFLTSSNPKAEESNRNSQNIGLVKAIICAGLYPNVAMLHSVKYQKSTGKLRMRLDTPEDGRVEIHPRSINMEMPEFESPFLLYHLKLKSSAIFLHDTTMVYPLPLLFFGQGVDFLLEDGEGVIAVSDDIRFHCRQSTADIVKELRSRLDWLLEYKVTHPDPINWSISNVEGAILRAIIELITQEDKKMMMVAQDGDDCDSSEFGDFSGCRAVRSLRI